MGGSLGIFDYESDSNKWDDFVWTLKNYSVTRINLRYYPAKFEGKNLEEALVYAWVYCLTPFIAWAMLSVIAGLLFMKTNRYEFIYISLVILLSASINYFWIMWQLRKINYVVHILPKLPEPPKSVYTSIGGGGYGDSGGGGFFYGDGGAGAAAAISCGDGGGAC